MAEEINCNRTFLLKSLMQPEMIYRDDKSYDEQTKSNSR